MFYAGKSTNGILNIKKKRVPKQNKKTITC